MRLKKIISVFLVLAAVGFGIAGFVVPPTGIISNSVLWLIAQFLLYSATVLGIDIEALKILKQKS